jgi:hypothetical protein
MGTKLTEQQQKVRFIPLLDEKNGLVNLPALKSPFTALHCLVGILFHDT